MPELFGAARAAERKSQAPRQSTSKRNTSRQTTSSRQSQPAKMFNKHKSPVDGLTEAQLDEFREAFDTFDEDGGGTIDKDELRKLLNYAGQAPTEDELQNMINIIDAEGTGDINFPEFVTLMAHKMANEASEETLQAAFDVFDTDGSGAVSAVEFHRVITQLGETGITVEEVNEVLNGKHGGSLGDVNGDGLISYEEFRRVLQEEKRSGIKGKAAHIKAVEKDGQHGQLGYGKMVSQLSGA